MPPNFIFWNFVFTKKNRTQFPVYCQCTQYWVHHGVAPNKKKFVTFHFPAQQLQKKGSENHENYVFSEKYKKAMFVCIKKAGRGKIEILDKLSSYAILSKGAIFHCSISKKKANSCLPAVIGVLFKWTILFFRKCNKNSQLLCKNSTFSLHR